jgi:formate hydrogenlyase subunit 6/NADH:ubiquinone oxidoreductase subunit I
MSKTLGLIKWIFKKPYTEPLPKIVEEAQKPPEYYRALPVIDINKCKLCGTCERNCPAHVIKVDRKERVIIFDYPRCIMCAQCATACPANAITMSKPPEIVPGPKKAEYVGIFRIPAPPPKPAAKPTEAKSEEKPSGGSS